MIKSNKKNALLKIATASSVIAFLAAAHTVGQMEKRYNKLLNDSKISARMLTRFIELSDQETTEKIKEEFQFESMTRQLDL